MGRLLEHASGPLARAVLEAPDIGEAETHRLFAVFGSLARARDALFGGSPAAAGAGALGGVGGGSGGGGGSEGGEGGPDDDEGPLGLWWQRLMVLRDLMVWRLDEVHEQLAAGTFRCLSGEELAHLLEALFEDSEKLRRTLTAVRQA